MSLERTLSIVKPDAVAKNHIGPIISKLEKGGLKVLGAKMVQLSTSDAQKFYEVHKERPFYSDLVKFMTSGPVLVMVLEGTDAVAQNRKIMGATDWQKSETGTIRREFATSIEENAVHGSDSKENAEKEIAFFFKNGDVCPRMR